MLRVRNTPRFYRALRECAGKAADGKAVEVDLRKLSRGNVRAADLTPRQYAYLAKRDQVVRAAAGEGGWARVAVLQNSNTCATAQRRFGLAPPLAALWAKAATASSLINVFLKGEERIVFSVVSDDPRSSVSGVELETTRTGQVRGRVLMEEGESSTADLPSSPGASLLSAPGRVVVQKILYEQATPIQSFTPMVDASITAELQEYFSQSEQIPSLVELHTAFDETGTLTFSGGVLVQALPQSGVDTEHALARVRDSFRNNSGELFDKLQLGTLLPQDALQEVLPELRMGNAIDRTLLDFFCPCSLENFRARLLSLGKDTLEQMQARNMRHITCAMCNEKHEITDEAFHGMCTELDSR